MPTETEQKSTTFKKGKIYQLSISDLNPDSTSQPRKTIENADIEGLKLSIEQHGQLSPIIFRVDENNSLILVSGERRFRACQSLGKSHINGIFLDSEKYDEIALVDNVQRVDLHPIDEAEAIKSLKTKYDYTQEQLGNIVGKAQNTITDILGLMKLSQEIRDDARQRKELSRAALLKIARMGSKGQKKAYDALVTSLSAPKKEIKRPRLTITKKTLTTTDNSLKCIKSIDLNSLGDDRDVVVSKLQELLHEIQNKLGTIDS